MIGVLAVISALSLGSVAVASKGRAHVFIHSSRWEIAAGGRTYPVDAGGHLIYHPRCQTIESITPVVQFTVKGSGVDSYQVKILGPKSAGLSDGTEKVFTGRGAVADVPFKAVEFSKLSENTDVPSFPAGVYSVWLKFHGAKPQRVETIKLIGKKQC